MQEREDTALVQSHSEANEEQADGRRPERKNITRLTSSGRSSKDK